MNWRHPSDAALDRWSSGGLAWRTARHAGHCSLCLERLERITELEPELRARLETELSPGPTLQRELWDRLERRIAEQETFAVTTDLLAVGPDTAKVVLAEDEIEATGVDEDEVDDDR